MHGLVAVLAMVACAAPPVSQPPPRAAAPVAHLAPPVARYVFATASDAEHQLFAAINDARIAAGLAPLRWSEEIAAVAHQGGAQLDFGKLALAELSVNLATADDAAAAVAGWLHDDHERGHFLSATVTQIGVAVSPTADGRVAATAVVFRTPAPIDTAALAKHVDAVLQSRDRTLDGDLQTIAQQAAEKLAAHDPTDDVFAMIQSQLRGPDSRWEMVRNSITRLGDAADLERDDQLVARLLGGQPADQFGVGVAQGKHPESVCRSTNARSRGSSPNVR
jgi:hypothetical protein